ncbi:MAG: hypothetical protein C4555_05535 [Dehalococcoidia bacterium]|nr:MAG: hypothetical protein C4555_05535 [Dehalococcoidia bacterium]
MRSLTPTLTAAQKAPSRLPYVKLKVKNTTAGLVRLDWERLYAGSEADYRHAATMPGDGSLLRVRVDPQDNHKLYRQRVTDPAPGADFSQWTYTSHYGSLAVAAASLGAEASIFWINDSREIRQAKSTDCGASWGSPVLIGYSPTVLVGGLAAAYKPGGDIALLFTDQETLYIVKRTGGNWGTETAWDKTTGNLSSVAAVYDGDWHLLLSGRDTGGNYRLWSLVCGDGDEQAAGTWSDLKTVAQAPSDGDYRYGGVFLDIPDVHRAFFSEQYEGTEAYQRPFFSHTLPETSFLDNLWREPLPFDLQAGYGLALTHHGDRAWLSAPFGVWRAKLTEESLDLSGDVLSAREKLTATGGELEIELRNDDGRYALPGTGELALLETGNEVEFSPGYITPDGKETSDGQSFCLEAFEHTSAPGRATLVLRAYDGWRLLGNFRAGHQLRWNKAGEELNVKGILAFVLARAGLRLEVKSQSDTIGSFYPDFTFKPGDRGDAIIRQLLDFVPDVLRLEGAAAYLINPRSDDPADYGYGTGHAIFEGSYAKSAPGQNLVEVEGRDPESGEPIIVNVFDWDEIGRLDYRRFRVGDSNLSSVMQARARGESVLRKAAIASGGGFTRVPVNCGQQLYDIIEITDPKAGMDAVKKRVLQIGLDYQPARARYEMRLGLGDV